MHSRRQVELFSSFLSLCYSSSLFFLFVFLSLFFLFKIYLFFVCFVLCFLPVRFAIKYIPTNANHNRNYLFFSTKRVRLTAINKAEEEVVFVTPRAIFGLLLLFWKKSFEVEVEYREYVTMARTRFQLFIVNITFYAVDQVISILWSKSLYCCRFNALLLMHLKENKLDLVVTLER